MSRHSNKIEIALQNLYMFHWRDYGGPAGNEKKKGKQREIEKERGKIGRKERRRKYRKEERKGKDNDRGRKRTYKIRKSRSCTGRDTMGNWR